MILARYILTVSAPEIVDAAEGSPDVWATDARVLANLPAMLEAVEENLEDILPNGYEVEIEVEVESS